VAQAVSDPINYATAFGYSGTYYDYVKEIAEERGSLKGLMNLDVGKDVVLEILKAAEFTGYRLDGALEWIMKTLEIVRSLG